MGGGWAHLRIPLQRLVKRGARGHPPLHLFAAWQKETLCLGPCRTLRARAPQQVEVDDGVLHDLHDVLVLCVDDAEVAHWVAHLFPQTQDHFPLPRSEGRATLHTRCQRSGGALSCDEESLGLWG